MRGGTAAEGSTNLARRRELNILFTCAGRRVALLRAFREAMNALGVAGEILASDVTLASPGFQVADVGLIVPRVSDRQYIPELLRQVRRRRIGLLVPLTDLDLRLLARSRDEFARLGCAVMIGSEEVVSLCRHKARSNDLVASAGLRPIRTCSLQEFLRRPFYPCFVKPVRGSASVGAGRIRDEGELRAHVATYGLHLLVQEYLPGQEFTIDVYRSRDGQVRCVVPRQRLAVRSGEVERGITVKDPVLIDEATRLAGALGDIWGVFCCQCRRPPKGRAGYFEINPRFGGGVPLSIAAGANLPLYLLQEVLGLPITARLGEFTDRLLMLRYDEALFVQVDDPSSLPGHDTPTFR